MSAGTLTLTNNSDLVSGAETSFSTELTAGDFIVVTVGGVPYTLPIKSVESDTELTLVSVFTGPTQSESAWSAVPRVALNMVTAALVAQSAEALRGLNYDKQNWQQVYSASGNITVKLPDGSSWNGPSWNSITTDLDKKANVSDLGSAASKNTGNSSGDVMTVGAFGIGAKEGAYLFNVTDFSEVQAVMSGSGTRSYRNNGLLGGGDQSVAQYSPSIWIGTGDTWASLTLPYSPVGRIAVASGSESVGRMIVRLLWDNASTVVDGNGFIKQASPVVKIYSDGRYDTNDEAEGVTVTRIMNGVYLIEGCTGLNADAAWGGIDGGFEIPIDRNKLARIWLDYEVNADGSILVKTYHRTHPNAPDFARNEIDALSNGDPVDIPADSFVSVRIEMPPNSIWSQRQKEVQDKMNKSANDAEDKTESDERT